MLSYNSVWWFWSNKIDPLETKCLFGLIWVLWQGVMLDVCFDSISDTVISPGTPVPPETTNQTHEGDSELPPAVSVWVNSVYDVQWPVQGVFLSHASPEYGERLLERIWRKATWRTDKMSFVIGLCFLFLKILVPHWRSSISLYFPHRSWLHLFIRLTSG